MTQVDLSKLSVEELRAQLAKKEKATQKALEKERKDYEYQRDQDMQDLMDDARYLNEKLMAFKEKVHAILDLHAARLAEYGKMRSNSKGGFSLHNSQSTLKIRRRRDTQPTWDERSEKALELIQDFLKDTVKKRDKKLFEILYSFIARNKKGDLEYAKVMHLLSHEDKYDDTRWKEGLRLIKESYSSHLKGYQYDFEVKNPKTEKFKRLDLNFSQL